MGSTSTFAKGSEQLRKLADLLRHYKPPNLNNNKHIEAQRIREDNREHGFSSAGDADPQKKRVVPNRAAVLICLFEGINGDLRVILTKRSARLSTHSGEVSLPGGKVEEGDANDIETAMREAKEEIGLDPSLVDVVTVLEPYVTLKLMTVVPVVGILYDKHAFEPMLNTGEVEAIFYAPLEMFLKIENQKSEKTEKMALKYLIHFFDYEEDDKKYLIWGLTATLLIEAASIAYQRPPDFTVLKPNFKQFIPVSTENATH